MSISLATSTTQNQVALANDTRKAEFEAFVREQGRNDAVGDDALPVFAIGFVRAVYDGVIESGKDANGDDAAARYFKMYAGAKGKKAFHDRSEGSQKAQTSKLRQLEKAAANPKYDFVDVLNRAVTIRQTAINDGIDVKSPFPAYVDTAREQLKQDDELDDAQIFSAVTKTEATREVTLEGQIKKMRKIADDIISGEKHPGVFDQSPEMLAIGELIAAKDDELTKLKTKRDRVAEIVAMGGTQNADGSWTV